MIDDFSGFWGDAIPDEAWGAVAHGDPLALLVLLIAVLLVVAYKALPARARRGGTFGRDW